MTITRQKLPVVFGFENIYPSEVSIGWVCYVHGVIPKPDAEYMWFGPDAGTDSVGPILKVVCGDCILDETEIGEAETIPFKDIPMVRE